MRLHKRIFLIFLLLMLILTVKSFALSEGDIITFDGITTQMPEIYTSDEVNIEEDPLYSKYNTPSLLAENNSNNISDIISKYETSGNTAVGIDVSTFQGDIDWSAVKNSGVKFVMIRCGYRGYGTEGNLVIDSKFENNIKGALDNEIYVGIYFFSAAKTEEEALQEAAFAVDLIRNYDIKYPIAYDFEYFGDRYDPNSGNPYRTNGLSNEQLNANAKVFLNYIRSQGYTPSLYGSSSYLNSTWDLEVRSNNDVWVAHYGASKPSYTGSYTMWQYTNSGSVPGINANVDIDIDYSYYMNLNNIDITNYLFDATYYADKYSDLKKAYGYNESQLKEHWLNCGIKEGRSSSPVFDPVYYVNKYSDLKSVYGTDYVSAYNHFIAIGIREGRIASKYFDVNYYISNNLDVKKAYYSSKSYSLVHFATSGIKEGRQGSSEFNVKSYYNSQDNYTKKQLGTIYLKYYALADGGSPINNPSIDITNYLFNATYYADKYSDLKKAYGYNESQLKEHWLNCGIKEGRSASPVFDPVYYVNKYSDLKAAFGTNYVLAYNHFRGDGIKEGRQASKYFNVKYYLNNYVDLQETFGPNNTRTLEHFMVNGIKEGRQGSSEFNVVSYYNSQNSYTKKQLGTTYLKYYALADGGSPINDSPIDITNYLFDAKYYADKYSDLKKAYGYNESQLKEHWLNCGIKEGRSASPVFDPVYYVNKYSDLKSAFGTNYVLAYNHFIGDGIKEGRQGSSTFNAVIYISNYSDLQTEYGSNYSKALKHYMEFGRIEDRKAV